MKKILTVTFALMLSVVLCAQNNVTKFLGIPVTGSKAAMIQKLRAKGFTYNNLSDCLEGEFNGRDVWISVVTNNNKVWRIAITDKNTCDEGQIKIRFNTLCMQFENNPKYVAGKSNTLSESEDISYEMTVNKKQYQAAYAQLPLDEDTTKRLVWFAIYKDLYGKYGITILYDNEFNHANGEDL